MPKKKVLSKFINRLKWLFFSDIFKVGNMGIRFGHFDPLQLIFQIMNTLMRKGYISYEEAREIIRASLPPEMPDDKKEAVINSMIRRTPR